MNWQNNQTPSFGAPNAGPYNVYGSMANYGASNMPVATGLGTSGDWSGAANWGGSPAMPGQFSISTPSALSPPIPGGGKSWWDGAIGTKEAPGWGGLALGAASGLASGFMAMKQYGLAKETLEQNRKQFETNFAAQKGLTNANLEDRQRARVASNAGAYQSVGDYMAQNGVK